MIKAAGLLSWRLDSIPASAQQYYVGLMKPHKQNLSQVVPNCMFFISWLPDSISRGFMCRCVKQSQM